MLYLTPLGAGMWEGMPAALGAEFDSAESIIDHVESRWLPELLHWAAAPSTKLLH